MDVNAETLHPDLLSLSLSFTRFNGAQTGGSKTRKDERKKEREEGNEGEERRRDDIKADPQSAKISPKGRKTSREIKRESAELLNLGVNQEGGPTFTSDYDQSEQRCF